MGNHQEGAGACEHGGAFFRAIGEDFATLDRRHRIVNADVLDAWFPPAPEVVEAVRAHLPWLLRTSPPVGCEGFLRAVAAARGLPVECLVPGAGSSDLIFRALPRWLSAESRALALDPTYGEYAHVLEGLIGCRVDRLTLDASRGFAVDPAALREALAREYDLVVLVNPNNPTGRHIPRAVLEPILRDAPARTRFWIDEAYVEYAGPDESLERFAAASGNVVVCKSLSKVYALSGARAAYLCAPPHLAAPLRRDTPPWAIGLPAQVAAVAALGQAGYYQRMHRRTATLRAALAGELEVGLGLEVHAGCINCVLVRLPEAAPPAPGVAARCATRGVFIRDCSSLGPTLGPRYVRLAVRDRESNRRIVAALREALAAAIHRSVAPRASSIAS